MMDINQGDNTIEYQDPIIDSTGCCYDSLRDEKIYNCILSEDGSNISGYTEEGVKAKYIFNKHKWYYGNEISRLNLITLADRDPLERKRIQSLGNEKRKENNEKKRSLNDIAKTMLTIELSKRSINEILGDSQELIGDNRDAGTVMIAKMIQTAMAGSFKAAEFVRDTAGYKPENKSQLELNANIMTDEDRSLLDKVNQRLTG